MLRIMMTVCAVLLLGQPALAASRADGQWILTTDRWGNPEYSTLDLIAANGKLSGKWDGDAVDGTISDGRLAFSVRDKSGAVYRFDARIDGATLRGTADFPDNNDAARRLRYGFTGRRVPDRPPGGPQIHNFVPTSFANSFSAERAPVLTIWPGDTVRTTTIDSGGIDATGLTRALFGNPQTGPFFIAGAQQGDTLVVHIRALTPNRDWADSLDTIVGRALGNGLV
ncbi:MAG: acetamidase, partial [Sphingomonas sp.]